MTCTFFGHRDCSEAIKPKLYKTIESMIIENNCKKFYVGNHGNFDSVVSAVLEELQKLYNIKTNIVLAYMPTGENIVYKHQTVLPEGIERTPKRFAINFRNKWMVDNADIVVTFVKNTFGGAATFKEYAIKKNKTVIELCE